jgi:hypothetical protein
MSGTYSPDAADDMDPMEGVDDEGHNLTHRGMRQGIKELAGMGRDFAKTMAENNWYYNAHTALTGKDAEDCRTTHWNRMGATLAVVPGAVAAIKVGKIKHLPMVLRDGKAIKTLKRVVDAPPHFRRDRFYVTARELLDESNVVRRHPLNPEQLTGSDYVGHAGVSNLSNADLLKFGGPHGNDPISGFRSYPNQGYDHVWPGPIINIGAGHHRLEEIKRRVLAGQIDPGTLIEFQLNFWEH